MSTTMSFDVILYESMGGEWTPWTGYIISSLAFDSCTLERLKGSERRLSFGGSLHLSHIRGRRSRYHACGSSHWQ